MCIPFVDSPFFITFATPVPTFLLSRDLGAKINENPVLLYNLSNYGSAAGLLGFTFFCLVLDDFPFSLFNRLLSNSTIICDGINNV